MWLVTMANAGSNMVGSSSIMSRPVRASELGGLSPLANSGAISEENHIDLAAFGSLCAAHVVLDLQRAVGRNLRMAPGGNHGRGSTFRYASCAGSWRSLLRFDLKHSAGSMRIL